MRAEVNQQQPVRWDGAHLLQKQRSAVDSAANHRGQTAGENVLPLSKLGRSSHLQHYHGGTQITVLLLEPGGGWREQPGYPLWAYSAADGHPGGTD